jgi:hypothetical protein
MLRLETADCWYYSRIESRPAWQATVFSAQLMRRSPTKTLEQYFCGWSLAGATRECSTPRLASWVSFVRRESSGAFVSLCVVAELWSSRRQCGQPSESGTDCTSLVATSGPSIPHSFGGTTTLSEQSRARPGSSGQSAQPRGTGVSPWNRVEPAPTCSLPLRSCIGSGCGGSDTARPSSTAATAACATGSRITPMLAR